MLQRVQSREGQTDFSGGNSAGPARSKPTLLRLKRFSDIFYSATLLLFFLPLALVLATMIRLAGGRVLAKGEEVMGLGGRTFRRWRWGDAQRTPAGWLTNELGFAPALINVLAGDMAMVGPRARTPNQYKALGFVTPEHIRLLSMRPGLIDVSEGGGARFQVEQELDYISNWTLADDLKVTFKQAILYLLGANRST